MAEANFRENKLHDIAFMGLRTAIGVIFIAHGAGKLSEEGYQGFIGWMSSMGIPEGMAILIALGELIPGILLVVGVLNRISASILALIMVSAIFIVKNAGSLTGERGYELDLILLAACLVVIVMGPGRVSLAHMVKKIPRFLH